ncbi:ribonuclease T2 [Andreprevotia lacus DSM 23236]|jgi:ribonuclease T2|uniref:Ribonuclease T2 n=1 Tax=Andreprevotia lacus DSM 23236 TaxID=1121001 RepID=A0A1W1XYZ4_9NEIS|nr:hypothetical protein [Andreprevotia lacus]SMC29136.1 ribonuclease T2 [Andreprevotia lacus DSM 23236]
MSKFLPFAALLACFAAPFAAASETATGEFLAAQRCEAYQSFNKGTNPGSVYTVPGTKYEIHEINTSAAEWYRVYIDGTAGLRWVSAQCGTPLSMGNTDPSGGATGGTCHTADVFDNFVLASSWQPGFCEHTSAGPTKPECQAMSNGSLVMKHLTLHGLWPNKASCGIGYDTCSTKALNLSSATVSYIAPWMPNFYYSQDLGDHEWSKHGVCQTKLDDDGYFRQAVDLVKALDASPMGQYIDSHSGGKISKAQFYSTVASYFGTTKAQNNFLLTCSSGYLQEIRVTLPKDIRSTASIKDAINGVYAASRASDSSECGESISVEASGK